MADYVDTGRDERHIRGYANAMGDLLSPRSCLSDLTGSDAVATLPCESIMPKMPGSSCLKEPEICTCVLE